MHPVDRELTEFVEALGIDQEQTLSDLFAGAYARLRQLAHAQRRQWRGDQTLSTTALVHEAYLKLSEHRPSRWENRGHFYAVSARAMRHILINYARDNRSAKRGGGVAHVTLERATPPVSDTQIEELLALDEALTRLERLSPRQASVVECRFFAGLDVAETAEALDVSPATVKRDWSRGQAWLYKVLHDDPAN